MPYVNEKVRKALDSGQKPSSAGELNYVVTKVVDAYLVAKGGLRYAYINEVVGVLECAKLEFYRRVAAKYEKEKMEESGDVYDCLK